MGKKARRRNPSFKLWRQQSEKRNASELNIYTGIQCVFSRGFTLGKLGRSQPGDCTQWGDSESNNHTTTNGVGSTALHPDCPERFFCVPLGWAASCPRRAYSYKTRRVGPAKHKAALRSNAGVARRRVRAATFTPPQWMDSGVSE